MKIESAMDLFNNAENNNISHFLQLNDNCLLALFSLKSFTLLDLCSIAETCQRFQQIVRRTFPKELYIRIRYKGDYKIKSRCVDTSTDGHGIRQIFKNFGPFLSGVSIFIPRMAVCYEEYYHYDSEIKRIQHKKQYDDSNFVLGMVARFCVGNLKLLEISGLKLPRYITEALKPVFARLEVLKIIDAFISEDEKLFAGCDSLTELRVVHVINCQAILANIFPRLERFGYGKPFNPSKWADLYSINVVIDNLSTFISLHPGLKKLILASRTNDRFLQLFGNGFDKLVEFGLDMSGLDVTSLRQLGALKSLRVLKLMHAMCKELTFGPFMAQLRELYLYNCLLPDDNSIQFLLQLTKLHIINEETPVPNVVNLIRQLINLKVLTIFDLQQFVLDEETFSKIVAVVDGRPHRLTMKCKFDFDAENWDDIRNVRLLSVVDQFPDEM